MAQKSTKPKSKDIEEKVKCSACGMQKKPSEYNISYSPLHAATGKIPYCKICVKSLSTNDDGTLNIEKLRNMLMNVDKPFLQSVLESTLNECEERGSKEAVGLYLKNLSLNYKLLTWKDSDNTGDLSGEEILKSANENVRFTEDDKKNKEDVIRLLRYDPFENEYEVDKPYLYSRLLDYLDESTLEDSFKLPASIEIVKSFNQIDKINNALSLATRDINSIAGNAGGIKSLFDAKEKILKSVLALAKDNGISVNHNNNKSKGAGTLSGIIKQLQEKGILESDINLFNIETCDGMKQVADISNRSILDQLMFDENDYTEMIKEQKSLIDEYRSKYRKIEEENRLLKMKLEVIKQQYESGDD